MTQPQTMDHQTNDVFPVALHHLRAVKCDTLNPLTLALTAWHCTPVESLETARGNSPGACTLPSASCWTSHHTHVICDRSSNAIVPP